MFYILLLYSFIVSIIEWLLTRIVILKTRQSYQRRALVSTLSLFITLTAMWVMDTNTKIPTGSVKIHPYYKDCHSKVHVEECSFNKMLDVLLQYFLISTAFYFVPSQET